MLSSSIDFFYDYLTHLGHSSSACFIELKEGKGVTSKKLAVSPAEVSSYPKVTTQHSNSAAIKDRGALLRRKNSLNN